MYAGFNGSESQRDQRDWVNNITTVDGKDTVQCFHVTTDATIDGFTITHGYTDRGGGMFNDSCSPLVANCTFIDNHTEPHGAGGMYNWNGSPTVTNCIFSGNTCDSGGGGGMLNWDCPSPKITSCIFSRNEALYGGGLYFYSSSPAITNCIFDRNSATDGGGGGILNNGFSPTMTNCTFSGNNANHGGGIFNYPTSSTTITNCILWGNTAITNGPQIYDYSGSYPTVTYCDIDQDGYAGSNGNIRQAPRFMDPANGDIHLLVGSPCIDTGDDNAPELPATDFEGDSRVLDGDTDGTATVDMGADEFGSFIEGTVTFAGVPCRPGTASRGVPPCNGPYPNFNIVVYRADGVTVETQAVSDKDGNYRIPLFPGSYIIYIPAGPVRKKPNTVNIVSGKTMRLDLVIDTGMRPDVPPASSL